MFFLASKMKCVMRNVKNNKKKLSVLINQKNCRMYTLIYLQTTAISIKKKFLSSHLSSSVSGLTVATVPMLSHIDPTSSKSPLVLSIVKLSSCNISNQNQHFVFDTHRAIWTDWIGIWRMARPDNSYSDPRATTPLPLLEPVAGVI